MCLKFISVHNFFELEAFKRVKLYLVWLIVCVPIARRIVVVSISYHSAANIFTKQSAVGLWGLIAVLLGASACNDSWLRCGDLQFIHMLWPHISMLPMGESIVCECWPILFVFIFSMKCVFGVNSGCSFSAFHLWTVNGFSVASSWKWMLAHGENSRALSSQTRVRVKVWVHCDGNVAWGVFWGARPRPLQPVCWSSWRPAPHSNGHLLVWTWLLHLPVLNKLLLMFNHVWSLHLTKNVNVLNSLFGDLLLHNVLPRLFNSFSLSCLGILELYAIFSLVYTGLLKLAQYMYSKWLENDGQKKILNLYCLPSFAGVGSPVIRLSKSFI